MDQKELNPCNYPSRSSRPRKNPSKVAAIAGGNLEEKTFKVAAFTGSIDNEFRRIQNSNPLDPAKKNRVIRDNFTYLGANLPKDGRLIVGELCMPGEFEKRFSNMRKAYHCEILPMEALKKTLTEKLDPTGRLWKGRMCMYLGYD